MKKDWMIRESELDDDQINVLYATLDKSCVVSGCAGSGKSVLALIKAQHIQKERGDSYQVIVYTKALANYMNSGRQALGLTEGFTYHWYWKNKQSKQSSDYIIVDEIQDFERGEVEEFIEATQKCFFFFGDTAQSLYKSRKDTMDLEDIPQLLPGNKPKVFSLYRNYRLPRPVARLVQYVGVGLDSYVESTYRSPETAMPAVLQYSSVDEQIKAIAKVIAARRLMDVAILLPHNDMVKAISEQLRSLGVDCEMKYRDAEDWKNNVENLNFNSQNPKVMTYHSAKGLQFEAVFLPLLEMRVELDDDARRALYVAMTRTYRHLYLMYSGAMPQILEQIPASLYQTTETDTIEDI